MRSNEDEVLAKMREISTTFGRTIRRLFQSLHRAQASEDSEFVSTHYIDMFCEDLSTLLPVSGARLSIGLDPVDEGAKQLIESGLAAHEGTGTFGAAVSDFIQFAARSVAAHGEACYEIEYEVPHAHRPTNAFEFSIIHPQFLVRRGPLVYKRSRRGSAGEHKRLIRIPASNLLRLRAPPGWSGEFRRISCGLVALSRVIIQTSPIRNCLTK
jgi:hypothetical protein